MRTAEYECEIGTTKHNARLHEAKAGGSHGAGDILSPLAECTRSAKRAAFGTAHEAHTSRTSSRCDVVVVRDCS